MSKQIGKPRSWGLGGFLPQIGAYRFLGRDVPKVVLSCKVFVAINGSRCKHSIPQITAALSFLLKFISVAQDGLVKGESTDC